VGFRYEKQPRLHYISVSPAALFVADFVSQKTELGLSNCVVNFTATR
jgi:hypothetical protein